MNPLQAFLHLLADPNIAFILFTLGFYGLIFELQNPNLVTGILGAFAIILAFIGFGSLPLNIAGLLLIGLAIVLFVLELTVTSHGLLAIGGLVAFALGASALYTEPGTRPAPSVEVATPDHRGHDRAHRRCSWRSCCGRRWRTRRMPPVNIGVGGLDSPVLPIGTAAEVRRAADAHRHRLCCGRGVDRPQRGRRGHRTRHAGAGRRPGGPDAGRRAVEVAGIAASRRKETQMPLDTGHASPRSSWSSSSSWCWSTCQRPRSSTSTTGWSCSASAAPAPTRSRDRASCS